MYIFNKEDIERIGAKATLVQVIAKAKILKVSELGSIEDRSKCVAIVDALGNKGMISMKELIERFRMASGRNIKIRYMQRGKVYILKEDVGKDCSVVKIPSGVEVKVGENIYDSNSVIVYMDGETMAIPCKYFKKMFTIREMAKNSQYSSARVVDREEDSIEKEIGTVDSNEMLYEDTDDKSSMEKLVIKDNIKNVEVSKRKSGNRVVAVIKNIQGKVVGYVIEDRKGDRHNVRIGRVMAMAQAGKIDNVVFNENSNGKTFLRGYGIRLESLPVVIL